jgi:hypothetical protein
LGFGFSSLAGISFVNWQKIGISGLAFFDEHAVEHRDNRHSYKTARAESARGHETPQEGPNENK